MYLNLRAREINLKIVYYGPALSGKTTNIEQIHARVDSSRRSELISLKTNEDRTLFFDFFQLDLGKINGLTPKVHLYTVPGQSYYEASRKVVLNGADGVVFVADSDPRRLEQNLSLWANMYEHFSALKLRSDLPVIVQFNKQDLPNALDPETLKHSMNVNDYSCVSASAAKGDGVLDTFKLALRAVMLQIQQQAVA